MVRKTIRLRSQHFKDLVNKVKKMNTVKEAINRDENLSDLVVLNSKIPTIISVK
ncbi:hypothetical protein [Proteus myxofaciens]|uniref:Uncharacterized protein n=1 Tax=Proteus myxofaciens ATCC 19692 TaxID=1354337 RepID=A0A198FED0_9GAMM|nr:hypothetical protein [Proteus myxofaciens]OAT22626.1 hypothetical protein M983_2888 [Proteus myxofaciens ATCC 19692]